MLVMIDNFDSFTYNLVQYFGELQTEVRVFRNNQIDLKQLIELDPDYLVISPGPGTPDDSGISREAIKYFSGKIPVLGVCLGHQCIAEVFGGRIIRAPLPVHGKMSQISHDQKGLFQGIAEPFSAVRYHSLVVEPESMPQELEVTATTDQDLIMGLRHRQDPTYGLQFHPESIFTAVGKELLANFLKSGSGKTKPRKKPEEGSQLLKSSLAKLIKREHLTEEEMVGATTAIMEGEATPAQIGGFLTALRLKGETVAEITGAARVMRQKALKVDFKAPVVIDTCGTGGDGSNTFNISTTAAFIVAAAGIPVAKHGNRAVSSRCGSADLLEALGIKVDLPPAGVEQCLKETGIGFLFAPVFHLAMKHAIGPRRELGFRTIFNLLGPLTNPAGANRQLIGVYQAELTGVLAEVLERLGVERAMVVHGGGGLDELSLEGVNKISFLRDGQISNLEITAAELGLESAPNHQLQGGDSIGNAQITADILQGRESGPRQRVVLLNAAAALMVAGLVGSLKEGLMLAQKLVREGAAYAKVLELQQTSMAQGA